MKLKTRIIISFFIIVLEPLLFTGLAFFVFTQYQFKVIEKQYGIENPTYESLSNTAEVVNRQTGDAVSSIQATVQNEPEKFQSIQYLETVNDKLEKVYSYLLVREDGRGTYYGCDTYPEELLDKLDKDLDLSTGLNDGYYVGGGIQALVKQINFQTADVEDGKIYIVSNIVKALPQVR